MHCRPRGMISVPPSIPWRRIADAANRVGVCATILIAAIVLPGCGADHEVEPICPRVATIAGLMIDAPSFGASYGDELPLLLDVCPELLECETFRMRSTRDRADPVDCSAEPGTENGSCELRVDDTLHLRFELHSSVEALQGESEVRVTLRREDGTPFAETAGQVRFEVTYTPPEGCGPPAFLGQLELEPEGWFAVP